MQTDYSLISDEELLKFFKRNSTEAFSCLYDKYAAPLYGVIFKLVKDDTIACEVLELSFITIFKELLNNTPIKGRIFVWMHNIGRDLALKALSNKIELQIQYNSNNQYRRTVTNIFNVLKVS